MTQRSAPQGRHCHELVAYAAKGIAAQFYELVMVKDDAAWGQWKVMHPGMGLDGLEKAFVMKMWPTFIEQARATLAKLLRGPTPDSLKDQISDALILDATLQRGRSKAEGLRLH